MILFSLLLTILVGLTGASSTLRIQASTFDSLILGSQSGISWIVEIYAEWCQHCQRFGPKYDEAATIVGQRTSAVQFAALDGDVDRAIKKRFAVHGFPSIFYFTSDELDRLRAAGETIVPATSAIEYSGPLSIDGMVDLGLKLTRPPVLQLPKGDWKKWMLKFSTNQVMFLLVTPADSTGSHLVEAYHSVANAFFARHSFAETSWDALLQNPDYKSLAMGIVNSLWSLNTGRMLGRAIAEPVVVCIDVIGYSFQFIREADIMVDTLVDSEASGSLSSQAAQPLSKLFPLDAQARKTGSLLRQLNSLSEPARALFHWVNHNGFPLVSRLQEETYPILGLNNEHRKLVIAIVDESEVKRGSQRHKQAVNVLRDVAGPEIYSSTNTGKDESLELADLEGWKIRGEYLFAFIDVVGLHKFLQQYFDDPMRAPRYLVIDGPLNAFWKDDSVQNQTQMLQWLRDISAGKAVMNRVGLMAIPQRLMNKIGTVPVYTIAFLILSGIVYLFYVLVIAEALGWNDEKERIASSKQDVKPETKKHV